MKDDELSDCTMIIYQIINMIDGKSYIGQSSTSFYMRYGGMRGKIRRTWWKYVDNKHLKNAIAKYGSHNFRVVILERGLTDLQSLDLRERYYIEKLNTLSPDGYNYVKGGQCFRGAYFTNEQRGEMSRLRTGRQFNRLLNNKTGEISTFVSIKQFCDGHGLDNPAVTRVLNGEARHAKLWTLPEKPLRRVEIIAPDGSVSSLLDGEIAPFCREHKINQANLCAVMYGKGKSVKGWRARIVTPEPVILEPIPMCTILYKVRQKAA